jgi:hypothetical protein
MKYTISYCIQMTNYLPTEIGFFATGIRAFFDAMFAMA